MQSLSWYICAYDLSFNGADREDASEIGYLLTAVINYEQNVRSQRISKTWLICMCPS